MIRWTDLNICLSCVYWEIHISWVYISFLSYQISLSLHSLLNEDDQSHFSCRICEVHSEMMIIAHRYCFHCSQQFHVLLFKYTSHLTQIFSVIEIEISHSHQSSSVIMPPSMNLKQMSHNWHNFFNIIECFLLCFRNSSLFFTHNSILQSVDSWTFETLISSECF